VAKAKLQDTYTHTHTHTQGGGDEVTPDMDKSRSIDEEELGPDIIKVLLIRSLICKYSSEDVDSWIKH
jgi:hypothetical protein